jgi:hypothetical protein
MNPPPGGAAGHSQQTPATQLNYAQVFAAGFGRAPTRYSRKRRKKARKRALRATRRTTRRKRSKAARFVKGSAAAKRFMAKLRRMQKRKRRA